MADLVPRIEFLLWSDLPEVREATLKRECGDLTAREFAKVADGRYVLNSGDDLRTLLQSAIGADWCAIIQAGTVLRRGFVEAVEAAVHSAEADVFMFAHILDKKKRGFGVHEQFILLNRKKWKQAGAPAFQSAFPVPVHLTHVERSPDNVHDDYTPLWLRRSEGEQLQVPGVPGWNFVDLALRNGCRVLNVPNSIRERKDFLYPEKHSEVLAGGIAALIADKSRLRELALEPYQKDLLSSLEP